MPYFARLWGRDSRRRPVPARFVVEGLESRTMLSGASTSAAVPLNVPTATSVQTGATKAEVGQYVPLVATVKYAGTGQSNGQPITGSVAFVTQSPNPIVLGEAKLNNHDQASLATNLIRTAGPYQINAEFLPANNYYAESSSAPVAVTINPATVNAPTVTSLQTSTSRVETGEPLSFTAAVQNADSSLADGVVEIETVARHPVVLGALNVGAFGQQINFTSFALQRVGTYKVEAVYVPSTNRFAKSISPPITVTVAPLTAASFRVTPIVRHGHLGTPLGFTVTAVNAQNQPVTNYTGTIVFSSPTDSWTIFPKSVYASLGLSEPPAQSTGLASFNPQAYTFTTADHGSHTFVNAVAFGKGGAESLEVTQANNAKVSGKTVFAIG
jgi:Bacterial Ig-like domain (group 3)